MVGVGFDFISVFWLLGSYNNSKFPRRKSPHDAFRQYEREPTTRYFSTSDNMSLVMVGRKFCAGVVVVGSVVPGRTWRSGVMYSCQLCGKDCRDDYCCANCEAVFYCSKAHMRRHFALQHQSECPRFLAAKQQAGVRAALRRRSAC
jgi:hypothetical protein